MSTPTAPHVVVVGAGFTGLLAARRLVQAGCRVSVVDGADRIGGQVLTATVAGRPIDVGSEATHLMYPQVGRLVDELGLRDTMVSARTGTSWVWTPRGLRPLPEGVGPAGPTRLAPVLRSRVMTVPGLVRAGLEPVAAGRRRLADGDDVAVGDFVAGRFGAQVADRLVDPLLGSLHSGDVRRLSLRACTPSLVPAATSGSSLLTASRKARAARTGQASGGTPPVSFVAWPEGLVTLTEALLAGVAVDVQLGRHVTCLGRGPAGGYRLTVADATHLDTDGVVLAIPAARAADLLRPLAPEAADAFAATPTASVATVVLGLPPPAYAQRLVDVTLRCQALPAAPALALARPGAPGALLDRVEALCLHRSTASAGWLGAAALLGFAVLGLGQARTLESDTSAAACEFSPEIAEALREVHPEADRDGDGELGREEACALQEQLRRTAQEGLVPAAELASSSPRLWERLCCSCETASDARTELRTEPLSERSAPQACVQEP